MNNIYIEVYVHFVRDRIAADQYVSATNQIVDVFTKALSTDRFSALYAKLNLVQSPQLSLRGNVGIEEQDQSQSTLAHSAHITALALHFSVSAAKAND